jgi:drug/metabolite transporter (DMT)-like permease
MKKLSIQRIKWLMLLVIIMWGSNFVFYKILVENFPFWTLIFFRNFFATIALLLMTRKLLSIKPKKNIIWVYVILASLTGIFLNNVLFQMGIRHTLATNVALIMALTPLATALISYLVFREPLQWKQVLGIFFGFFGVVLVIFKGSLKNLVEFTVNIGDLLVVGTLLLFSISFIFIKKATDEEYPSGLLTMYGHAISLIWILPISIWEQTTTGWGDLPTRPILWIMLIYMGLFPTALGNMLWNRGIGILGPSQSAIFMNGTPLVTAITSLILLGEPIIWVQVIGFLFIASGVILGSHKGADEKKAEKDQSSLSM